MADPKAAITKLCQQGKFIYFPRLSSPGFVEVLSSDFSYCIKLKTRLGKNSNLEAAKSELIVKYIQFWQMMRVSIYELEHSNLKLSSLILYWCFYFKFRCRKDSDFFNISTHFELISYATSWISFLLPFGVRISWSHCHEYWYYRLDMFTLYAANPDSQSISESLLISDILPWSTHNCFGYICIYIL